MIKECGLSKIYRPIMMQARNYKKDLSMEEKEKNKTIDKELQYYGKQLYYSDKNINNYIIKDNEKNIKTYRKYYKTFTIKLIKPFK